MAIRDNISEPVLQILFDLYCKSIKHQREHNGIKVQMVFDEYLSLWSDTRVRTLTQKHARGPKSVELYLRGSFRPVLSWKSREARELGGVMTVDRAAIMKAEESVKMFRFHKGDKHTLESKQAIGAAHKGKKQSEEHVQKRTQGQIGVRRGPMSDEAKAKLRATRAARKAAVVPQPPS